MDFSAFNPASTSSLHLAARKNDIKLVKSLLKKCNPSVVDNRGWTCLHEAAASDSYDSLELILKHPDCRPLAETFEGHTALYLACRNKTSKETIELLLQSIDDIANYASTEMVSPLHVVSQQGRVEIAQLLIDYGADINVQDFDGDTPLHDSSYTRKPEMVSLLLHAGAEPEMKNIAGCSPFHLACLKGCLDCIKTLHPFITNINDPTEDGDTALILATQLGSQDLVQFLLSNGANPNVINDDGELALNLALMHGHAPIFKILLDVTEKCLISEDIMITSCKPHYFNMDIIIALLESDLDPKYFNTSEKFYVNLEKFAKIQPHYERLSPLCSFLHNCEYIYNQSPQLFEKLMYLLLMRGVSVDALFIHECPPLVYIHYCEHTSCFTVVLRILLEHNCNVDYMSDIPIPDAILASMATGSSTLTALLHHSLASEPMQLLHFMSKNNLLTRCAPSAGQQLMRLMDFDESIINQWPAINFLGLIPTLKHLSRVKFREYLRQNGATSTKLYINLLNQLILPQSLQLYIRY